MTVMGQQVKQTQTQTFVMEWTPLGKNGHGDAVLRMKLVGIKMKIDIGGVNIAYDSERDQPASPMSGFFKQLLGAEFKFIVNARSWTVKTVTGHVELIQKIGPANPQMEPLLQSILSEEAMIEMSRPCFAFAPTSPVRRGTAWNRSHALNLGPIGTYRTESQYTYDGKAGPYERILVRTSLKYEAPKDKSGLPFTIKSADLKSTAGKGEILFDAARGRLVSSDVSMTLAGKLIVEIGGMETEVDLRQTQRTRIRVTDVNPHLQQSEPRRARRGYSRLSSN
jgi:hypothetical protein